jgi:hypothetical protein
MCLSFIFAGNGQLAALHVNHVTQYEQLDVVQDVGCVPGVELVPEFALATSTSRWKRRRCCM